MSTAPTTSLALAVDVGGTKVEAALIDADGNLRQGSRHRAVTGQGRTRQQLLEAIAEVVTLTRSMIRPGDRVVGTGIGSAGPISLADQTISPHNLPVLRNFALADFVRSQLDVATVLRLDGTCIALAEHWLGSTQGVANSLSMIVSTGVGGGIILNGRLFSGDSGNAGHIGQIQIATREQGHPRDATTLERLASGPNVVEWARKQGWTGTSGEDLAADYARGLPLAIESVTRSTTAVGEALASVATLLDLHHVAIGGGFVNVAPDYIERVTATIRESAVFDYAREVSVSRSGLSDTGPLVGAAALVHRPDRL